MDALKEKKIHIETQLKALKKVVVAFSGGIDSSLILKLAADTLGVENVVAVVVNSEMFFEEEFQNSLSLAQTFGVKIIAAEMSELADERIAANTPDSWYFSKKLLYETIQKEADQLEITAIIDGMILDDLNDYRPGLRARTEAQILSPLETAGMSKAEVRELARQLNITIWNKVSSCSVASRFPYGSQLTRKKVKQVMMSEDFIRKLGILTARVRAHDNLARIEVLPEDFGLLLNYREIIIRTLKEAGFSYVTLDCDGYQYGRMNETLTDKEKQAYA